MMVKGALGPWKRDSARWVACPRVPRPPSKSVWWGSEGCLAGSRAEACHLVAGRLVHLLRTEVHMNRLPREPEAFGEAIVVR